MSVLCVVLFGVVCPAFGDGRADCRLSEAPIAYELAWSAAKPVLPGELREFLTLNESGFQAHFFPSRDGTPREPQADEAQRHHVWLDAAARDASEAERRSAASEFPRKRAAARQLFETHELPDGGSLPWAIEEEYAGLVRALKEGDDELRLEKAAALMHLAVDAALPFNVVAPPRGHEVAYANQRDRFHGVLIVRLRDRLAYEARVAPERLRAVDDPLDAAITALLASHAAAMELARLDAELIAALGLNDVAAAIGAADEYLSRAAEASAPVLEARIEAGALLGANLIAGAWIKAGRPDLKAKETVAHTGHQPDAAKLPNEPAVNGVKVTPAAGETAGTATNARFIGSLGSMVYHRQTCAHCARIKLENAVGFSDAREAEAAGRKPCSACKPDQKQAPQVNQETK